MPRIYDFLNFCENCGVLIGPKKRYCRTCERCKAWLMPKSDDDWFGWYR